MTDSSVTNGFAKTLLPVHISDGELFIIGRINDLLIAYGFNRHPDDIGAMATSHEVDQLQKWLSGCLIANIGFLGRLASPLDFRLHPTNALVGSLAGQQAKSADEQLAPSAPRLANRSRCADVLRLEWKEQ